MDEQERRQFQRNFYLKLSPIDGHEIAEEQGGFVAPSDESAEAEIRDTLKLWLTLQQGQAGEIIANSAWWMTQYMDPEKRLAATDGVVYLDRLTSFAVAVMGQLLDAGVIELKEVPEIPDILLSTENLLSPENLDMLKNLESLWEDDGEQ